ncbi:MAG: GTPase, partial [Oscillospiraceae bacterium]
VIVPDYRIDELVRRVEPDKVTYAVIEFVDIAGLVKGASKGEGLGNKFLSNIREVDAIVHVVRAFEDTNIVHVEGDIDPIRDIETINLELILSDLEVLDRRIDKVIKSMRGGEKKYVAYEALYQRLKAHLEDGKTARSMELSEEELDMLSDVSLLSLKPVIYAANVAEDDYSKGENDFVKRI